MFRKFVQALTALFVVSALLSVAAPASAAAAPKRALKGTIVAIDSRAKTMTVAPLRGAKVKVRVARGATITRRGKASNFAKLHVGDKVNLKYNAQNNQASEVSDNPGLYEIKGTVESVDTTAGTLTIASEEGGNSVTLTVDATTVLERNGAPATLADMLVGDKVDAKYDSATMLAVFIKTEVENSDFKGAVAAIDTVANTVTVTPLGGGADVVLNISESTVFVSNDVVITIHDLAVGDLVEAEYDSVTMIASKIDVDNSSSSANH